MIQSEQRDNSKDKSVEHATPELIKVAKKGNANCILRECSGSFKTRALALSCSHINLSELQFSESK